MITSLENKKIIFLGSSVTVGANEKEISFINFLVDIDKIKLIKKEAVSGTTLVTSKPNNYIERLLKIEKTKDIDLFVTQLSTNDASLNMPLGVISNNDNYDTETIIGAIEYIISYVKENFTSNIIFYTNPKFDSLNYKNMVDSLYKIKDKWNIGIIDLYNDDEINNITDEERKLYYLDKIHPTILGYKDLWHKKLQKDILEFFNERGI